MSKSMRVKALVGFFLLYCSIGSACGSYEECMNSLNKPYKTGKFFSGIGYEEGRYHVGGADSITDNDVAILLKAVCFKLDEIEKIIREKKQ